MLLVLSKQPTYVKRLPTPMLVQLLNSVFLWICGDEDAEEEADEDAA